MKFWSIACCFVFIAGALVGCKNSTEYEELINPIEKKEFYQEAITRDKADSLVIDDKGVSAFSSGYTIENDQFISWVYGNKYSVNLNNGRVTELCNVPGCTHNPNKSDECNIYSLEEQCYVASESGMYYTKSSEQGKIYYKEGEIEKVVYENTYTNDNEREINPGNERSVGFFIRDNVMYIYGQTYFYMLDMNTMEKICEPVVITETYRWDMDVSDEYVYVTTESLELVAYEKKTGIVKKIDDKVYRLRATKDKLYYVQADKNSVWTLYMTNADGSAKKEIARNVSGDFFATENQVFYLCKNQDFSGIYIYNINSEASNQLEVVLKYEDGSEYQMSESVKIVSCPSSDNIYLIDDNKSLGLISYNALFVISKENHSIKGISLGVYDNSNTSKGSVLITY